ncbi:shikimate kinase [Flagellimonas pelagia]|uniref:Shikimate kinase n=1 Tax=Flagellimonas pelagia TaxID=2306998 RepID=A0A3A1NMI8_9FLAO|nr:shikimate kinase [Allomuricauda maritima]RIV47460.1 shikimate kinase [Allomuricauda maritima]TXK01295.1 AAA family ATPase [Allomuricauda maritima]
MKVVLMGYMASGKSTVGRLLASELGIRFIDLDDYIEEQEKKSIKSIFSEKGEIHFRKLEHQTLQKILQENESVVLSTGGGTPCYGNNLQTILEQADCSIYLQMSIPDLVDRIAREKEHRPLVKDIPDMDLPEFVGKHLFERVPYYSQANHVVNGKGKPEAVVTEIKKILF